MARMCLSPLKEDSSVCIRLVLMEKQLIIFVGLFINICNKPPSSPKYDQNIWLYYTLTEEEFNLKNNSLEQASGWGKHIGPQLKFLSQVFQGQSQEGMALGPLIIACEQGKKHTHILVFLNQKNNNCCHKVCGKNMTGSADILLYFTKVSLPFCCCVYQQRSFSAE